MRKSLGEILRLVVCLSVCLSSCLSVCLSVCLSACLSVYLSLCLYAFLSCIVDTPILSSTHICFNLSLLISCLLSPPLSLPCFVHLPFNSSSCFCSSSSVGRFPRPNPFLELSNYLSVLPAWMSVCLLCLFFFWCWFHLFFSPVLSGSRLLPYCLPAFLFFFPPSFLSSASRSPFLAAFLLLFWVVFGI